MKDEKKNLNILILYDSNSVHVNTISEHLHSFVKYSKHAIYYSAATDYVKCQLNLAVFDVVYIHYSVRINTNNSRHSLSPSYMAALSAFCGFKVLFIQDEYDTTNIAKENILKLGIHAVYTNVSEKFLADVYPTSDFKQVDFINTLTGYVPENLENKKFVKPLPHREISIGYRGRELPFWYGNLGREKLFIGQEMKKICQERNIKCNIEWHEDQRIYGDDWYEFLTNCRATLGTESGANIFDFTGDISRNIKTALTHNPKMTYVDIFNKYLEQHEGRIIMNQISPKIFEAISLRTALILFEGNYSNVIQPHIHYIELKKDFSNIDDVLTKVANDDYLSTLTQRAYDDIVDSGKYSYQNFVKECDAYLDTKIINVSSIKLVPILFASLDQNPRNSSQDLLQHLQMKGCLLSNQVLRNSDQLDLVNTLPYKNSLFLAINIKLAKNFNKLLTNKQLTQFLIKVNNLLPGKPISKIYYKMRGWLKI